jgi:hypothetical protein
MSSADLFQAMIPVLRALDEMGVTHYVGGSVASSALGLPRTTIDADLVTVLKPVHVDGLVGRLAGDYYVSEPMIRDAIQRESCFNLIHLATMFKVDAWVSGPGHAHCRAVAIGRVLLRGVFGRRPDGLRAGCASPPGRSSPTACSPYSGMWR